MENSQSVFNALLVEQNNDVQSITHDLNNYNDYVVQLEKNYTSFNTMDTQMIQFRIDGIPIKTSGNHYDYKYTLENPIIVSSGQIISNPKTYSVFNGYLVDEDFFADCGGSGGSSSSTPSSIDSAMVADMIAANTSSGSGGDWELLYDNFEADLPGSGLTYEFGIAPSDGFLYISGSSLDVRTGFDLDTIENTWSEEPHFHYIQGASINSLQPDLIPVKKDMFWSKC